MKTTFWEKNKRTICNLILVAVLVALVGCVDAFAPSSSMWFPVLRKVCTFALAAVAMNLLNGFTGLFSLGQAGFMLLGAYAYAILTIPVELRSTVFRNYGDSLVQFQMPLVLALLALLTLGGGDAIGRFGPSAALFTYDFNTNSAVPRFGLNTALRLELTYAVTGVPTPPLEPLPEPDPCIRCA